MTLKLVSKGVGVFDNKSESCCVWSGSLTFLVAPAYAPQVQSVHVAFLRIRWTNTVFDNNYGLTIYFAEYITNYEIYQYVQ